MATAMDAAGAEMAAAGEAERLALEAWLDGRARYSGKLGWAQRNLLETIFFYRLCRRDPRIAAESVNRARNHAHRAIKQYRHLSLAETRGIDTSAPGWRGGRAA